MLVRLAALVAMDGPPVSYAFTIGAAADAGVTLAKAQSVLVALAPLVGTARVTAAAGQHRPGHGRHHRAGRLLRAAAAELVSP